MATVRDLVNVGFDDGLVKQAVDLAGFERRRGRGGLELDSKGVAKVIKSYTTLLTKLLAKAEKVNIEKLPYGDDESVSKPKVEKKAAPKLKAKAKPVEEDDEEEEAEEADGDDQDDVDVNTDDDNDDDDEE